MMSDVHPRLTDTRRQFMEELQGMGVGEPYVRGTARNHLLRLGWIDAVYLLPDGSQLVRSEFMKRYPPGSNPWRDIKLAGVTLTEAGVAVLSQDRQQEEK